MITLSFPFIISLIFFTVTDFSNYLPTSAPTTSADEKTVCTRNLRQNSKSSLITFLFHAGKLSNCCFNKSESPTQLLLFLRLQSAVQFQLLWAGFEAERFLYFCLVLTFISGERDVPAYVSFFLGCDGVCVFSTSGQQGPCGCSDEPSTKSFL